MRAPTRAKPRSRKATAKRRRRPAPTARATEAGVIGVDRDRPVAVLGAGSWGTALAIQFARAGRPVRLWARRSAQAAELAAERRNRVYLPDAAFPDGLLVHDELGEALAGNADPLIAVPSHALRETLEALRELAAPPARVAWATKGFERGSGLLPHQVVGEVLGDELPVAVLSGPTFAAEVARGLPTALVVAASDEDFGASLAVTISSDTFRAYTSDDLVGVEVGGGVKNALAIGAGISDGLGFGANARVALITRGLIEMARLGVALGASRETFMGLACMGDLVLTCTDDQSRNRRMGLGLAAGRGTDEVQREIGQVVEGLYATQAVLAVARRIGVEMPIVEQIDGVLHAGTPPDAAVRALMTRSIKSEAGERVAWPEDVP